MHCFKYGNDMYVMLDSVLQIDNSMAAGDFTVPLGVIGSPNAVLIGANGNLEI